MVTLADKYAILQQQADAATMHAQAAMMGAVAGATMDRTRANLLGPQDARDARKTNAEIGHYAAQNRGLDASAGLAQASTNALTYDLGQTKAVDALAGGGNRSSGMIGGSASAPTSAMFNPTPIRQQNFGNGFGSSLSPGTARPVAPSLSSSAPNNGNWDLTNSASQRAGVASRQPTFHEDSPEGGGVKVFKKGTARVPGKGSPKKDTVPAKLAPGEAVLNAPAAESMGRGNIAAANRRGAMQMGMRPGPGNMPGHYATGTEQVMRSNSPHDQLPPVRGGVMTAPGDPRANLPPVVGPVMSQGPLPAPPQGNGVDAFMAQRGLSFAPEAAPQMPRIDHGPQVATPAGPQWSMPAAGGVPLPPMRPALLGGPSPVPPPVPQGRSMAQIEQQIGGGGPAFAPQPAWDQGFVDAHPTTGAPAMLPPNPGVGDFIPGLTVDYSITQASSGDVVSSGTFMTMNASDGPHYGANVKLDEAGEYKVTFSIHSPAENGWMLHVDPETGVEGRYWTTPIEATWNWNYTPQEW